METTLGDLQLDINFKVEAESHRTYVTISDGAFRVNWAEGQRSKSKDKW